MKAAILSLLMILLVIQAKTQDKYYITVALDGSGDFTTIQAAIDASKAFPDQRVTIHIKNGIYREKVVVPSCNTKLTLIGESADRTIITWDDYFDRISRGRNSTFYTYTLLVEADDFCAVNLTIENNAGRVGQAVALHIEGNRCVIRNCRIKGNQDTLYATGDNSSQYFKNCHIEGTTDFIFGSATVLFESCTIHCKDDSYITAASTPEGKEFGFVFLKCKITAADCVKKVFLGRPWRDYANVAFIQCDMGRFIATEGWSNWSGTSRDKTAFFAEFKNAGTGYKPDERVDWSYILTSSEAKKYTLRNILSSVISPGPQPEEWTKR